MLVFIEFNHRSNCSKNEEQKRKIKSDPKTEMRESKTLNMGGDITVWSSRRKSPLRRTRPEV